MYVIHLVAALGHVQTAARCVSCQGCLTPKSTQRLELRMDKQEEDAESLRSEVASIKALLLQVLESGKPTNA